VHGHDAWQYELELEEAYSDLESYSDLFS